VASVNGQKITSDQLSQECLARYGDQVLDNLLNKKLIMQACDAKSIEITNQDVVDEIGRIATKFNLNPQMYLKLIQEQRGITEWQYKNDIIWPMLALREIAADEIQVSQADVDKVFKAEYGPTVKVRMIAVQDPAQAQQLHQQAVATPDSFKRLAKKYSEDPVSASVEGLLPPIRMYSEDDQLERMAFDLEANEISNIFAVGDMNIFLQCVRHDPGTTANAQQKPIILERIRRDLRDAKVQEKAEAVFKTLRDGSSVVKVLGNPELERQYPGNAAFINNQPISLDLLASHCARRFGSVTLEGEINRKLLEGALQSKNLRITQADIDAEIERAAVYYNHLNPDNTPDTEGYLAQVLEEDSASLDIYIKDAVWPTVALKALVANNVQVSEQDMEQAFQTNYGPRAEVLAIVFSNQRTAQEVWQMARDNPTEQFFGELAAQYSVEEQSRSNYGKVVPLRRFGQQPTLEKIAFEELKPGEMSGIIEIGQQFVVLRSQGFTSPVVRDQSVVRDELYKDVLEKKTRVAMRIALDQLLESAQIDNYLDATSQLGAEKQAALQNEVSSSR
jgi:parvulin-like peptidyl-prolyl isomerase